MTLSYETSYEDVVTAEIMDWAVDTMPDEAKNLTLQEIADKYWEEALNTDVEYADDFFVLSDFDSEPITDLVKTHGKQPLYDES